ncbi:hypothetical protein LMG19145_01959 [Xanthomonas arboricola pv. fragariae]|nr:hypothetical protein LMG19145_01959 [Xanthomonas arboricola pv. fragariae]
MYGNSFDGMIGCFATACALAGGAIFAVAFWLIPWLWELLKPWLHTVTA